MKKRGRNTPATRVYNPCFLLKEEDQCVLNGVG
jgi:hypothetical protein